MSGRFRMKEFGRPISVRQALSYLDSQGWKTRSDRGLIACEGPADDAGQPIIAFIPTDETCPDYPLRLEDLIFVLSTLEERPAVEIADEMAEVPKAVVDNRQSRFDELIDIFREHIRGTQSATVAEQFAKDVLGLAENSDLALMTGHASFQEAALILAGCARILSTADEPKLLLWRLCEWIGLQLRNPSPAILDQLHDVAFTASPESPEALLKWLWSHTRHVADTHETPDEDTTDWHPNISRPD